jgi:streptogramin lyase
MFSSFLKQRARASVFLRTLSHITSFDKEDPRLSKQSFVCLFISRRKSMKRPMRQSHLIAFSMTLITCLFLLSQSGLPALAAGSVTAFSPAILPRGITAGPDGNLWYVQTGTANKIGRITPGGTITNFPIPTANSEPEDITAGPDGNLWFTETEGSKIGRITTAGHITEFPFTPRCGDYGCGPIGITTGPDGNLWFTLFNGSGVEGITTNGTFIAGSGVTTKRSQPYGITTGPDGNLWFTENNGGKIARVTL